jgi:hypothetical protein
MNEKICLLLSQYSPLSVGNMVTTMLVDKVTLLKKAIIIKLVRKLRVITYIQMSMFTY